LGDGKEHDSDPTWDAIEADTLYALLENEVIPEFYRRDRNGIPVAWVARIRESMARLTTYFSSNRTVRQYSEHYYLPAAATYRERAANKGEVGVQIVNWRHALERTWGKLRFGETTITKNGDQYLFEVQVFLNGLDPEAVRVELYAEGANGGSPVLKEMKRGLKLIGAENGYLFGAQVQAARPATDYTARVIPHRTGMAVPLEAAHILWQR
jgi:starch phosphorylase